MISTEEIRALIPHSGRMCLLTRAHEWNAERLLASADNHRAIDHPMAFGGRLHTLCGIEYAAQAMALHGAITALAGKRPKGGMLIALRDVQAHVRYLDDIAEDLLIEVERLVGEPTGVIYRFSLTGGARALLHGRATVVLDAG